MKNVILSIVLVLGLCNFVFAGSIDSPIAYWTFDETSGTTAYDSMGNYNGIVSGATWTTGKIGGALSFDGINDYANLGDIAAMEFGTNDFSISFWFYINGTKTSVGSELVSKYSIRDGRQWLFGLTTTNVVGFATYYGNDSSLGNSVAATESYPLGEWVCCTGVKQGATMYLYIDGVLAASGACNGTTTGCSTDVTVGALESGSTYYNFFNGLIDDIRVYDYALSASEVYELYTIPEPATICLFALAGLLIRNKK